jgi:hypothetical protein
VSDICSFRAAKNFRGVRHPSALGAYPNWPLRKFVHHILEPVEMHPESLYLVASVTSVVTTLGSPRSLPRKLQMCRTSEVVVQSRISRPCAADPLLHGFPFSQRCCSPRRAKGVFSTAAVAATYFIRVTDDAARQFMPQHLACRISL